MMKVNVEGFKRGLESMVDLGKAIATKENAKTAVTVLGSVGIGVMASKFGVDKKQGFMGKVATITNNRKTAGIAGLGAVTVLGATVGPKVAKAIKATREIADEIIE